MDFEHPDILLKLLKIRQRELWQEATMRALARQAKAATPRRPQRRLSTLRQSLMSYSLRIKAWLQPSTPRPMGVKRHTSCPVQTTPTRDLVSIPLTCQELPSGEVARRR